MNISPFYLFYNFTAKSKADYHLAVMLHVYVTKLGYDVSTEQKCLDVYKSAVRIHSLLQLMFSSDHPGLALGHYSISQFGK